MKNHKIIILTGYSGSGKSIAIASLEDSGFYCVDNLPVTLLPKLLELPIESNFQFAGFAFVMDVREKGFLSNHTAVFDSLKSQGYSFKILFLEADEEVLIQRYSQTRRHHPLSGGKTLIESIRAEKEQMKELRIIADHIIDTSHYKANELKAIIREIGGKNAVGASIQITILSFGFKFGVPKEADLLIDVRFITNPYYVPELRQLDGKSTEVKIFVLDNPECRDFLSRYCDLLDYLIPLYEKEGKNYLTLAVGCTGGRHRSVVIAEAITDYLKKQHPSRLIDVQHRDILLP